MAKLSTDKKSATISFSGIAGVIGAITALCTTPSFVGAAGVGKAVLVGLGTSFGTILALPGALIGVGLGLLTGSRTGVLLGAVVGGVAAGGYGAVQAYDFSKDALTEGCKAAFNVEAGTPAVDPVLAKVTFAAKPSV